MKKITWVIKASKLCNLRCRYCYEMENLSNKERISENNFPQLFRKIKEISSIFDALPKLCWHGGEPLLLPASYFNQIFHAQDEIFLEGVENVIQTNLVPLTNSRIALLKRFDHVSISIDVFGELRVDKRGKNIQSVVLDNMDALKNAEIKFGAIATLTKKNLDFVDSIFDFFNESGISFRLLPFYRSAAPSQQDLYAISQEEVATAMLRLVDLWFSKGNGIHILPVDEYLAAAIRYLHGTSSTEYKYDKEKQEHVFIVDTNGDIYSVADTYSVIHRYGNIFLNDAHSLVNSIGRNLSVADSHQRMQKTCNNCQYFGACSGWPMGEATVIERSNPLRCGVASLCIDRAREWLQKQSDINY